MSLTPLIFNSHHDKQKTPALPGLFICGGEGGIRTLDTRLTYTPLAGERLQPLGHLTKFKMLDGRFYLTYEKLAHFVHRSSALSLEI